MKAMNMNHFGNKEQQLLSQAKSKSFYPAQPPAFKTWIP